jgi:hypothetical protein
VQLQKINPCWNDVCIVAGSGPSLTLDIAEQCRGYPVVAVNDAYRRLPFADVLYACDGDWWRHHNGCLDFAGERWSSHGNAMHNDKREIGERYGISLIRGADSEGFSLDPSIIHYGAMGGFQAVNIAGHKMGWKGKIILVGFDMTAIEGHRHFFGEHPKGLRATRIGKGGSYEQCIAHFGIAAKNMPAEFDIVNCSPASALTVFRIATLGDELKRAT